MLKHRSLALATMTALVIAVFASGCSNSAQERYQNAVSALKQARQDRVRASKEVKAKQAELAKLQDKLKAAQNKLDKARKRMQAAAAQVNKNVNDAVLFRTIQRELLDKTAFGDSAIAVGVENRVVTLTGTVPDKATRKAAIKAARSHPGVKDVVAFLKVKTKRGNNGHAGAETGNATDQSGD